MAALGVVGRGASARSPARQMEIPLAGALCVPRRNWRISLHGFDVAPIDRMAGTQVVSRNAKHFFRRANALRRGTRLRVIGARVARDSRFGSGFSARIVRLVDSLPNTRAANHLGGQLLHCGTSPYGNHGEVEAAESRKDFVHKSKVCLKELKETRRWLGLIAKSSMIPAPKMSAILNETEELIKIFFSSVRTAERNVK